MQTPAVHLADVSVAYPNGTRALDAVNLVVQAGERVALVGPSGAGKSTLLNLLNGRTALEGAAVSGTVGVLGIDTAELRGRARRRHGRRIGVVRQHLDLVGPLRVIHNVNAGLLGDWSPWRALLSLARPVDRGLNSDVLSLVGLDASLLDVTVDELSGGQRQRVAIARVVRQRPDLLLADEPVASLDPTLSSAMLDLVASPPDGAAPGGQWTALVSLHQPEFARRFAERVIGLKEGRIVFDVAVGDLTDELLDRLYARQ